MTPFPRLAGLLAVSALVSASWAQNGARPATLAELGRATLERPSPLQVARAEQAAEAARLAQAKATRWPSLAAGAGVQRQRAEGASTTADVTGGDSTTALGQLTLSWTLLDTGRGARIDAQGQRVRAAESASDEARTEVLTQLLDAYVAAAVADQELALVEAQMDGLREQAARSGRRLAAGVDTRLDALEVETNIESLGAERARLRGEREIRRASLLRLSGQDVQSMPWLRAEWPQALRDAAQSTWVAERRSSGVDRQRALADAAAARAAAESGDLAPILALNSSVGRLNQRISPLPSQTSNSSQIGLQLQIPFDLGGGRRARADEAAALSARERAALDDAVARVDGAWRVALAEYEQARDQLEALERAAAIARETLAATQRARIAGLRSGLDLIAAHQRHADGQRAALRARAAMLQALARASALAGPWDVAMLERFDQAFAPRPR